MSEQLINEKIIADKLNSLPVPDMENIIWNRINGMLDTMPAITKNQQYHPGKNYKILAMKITIGIVAIIVAIICLVIIKSRQRDTKPALPVPSVQKQPVALDSPDLIKPGTTDSHQQKINNIQTNQKKISIADTANRIKMSKDSQNVQQAIKDSGSILCRVLPPAKDSGTISSKDPAGTFKKNRGVKGIADSNYRMLPVKKN
jgi:hypothetical protein